MEPLIEWLLVRYNMKKENKKPVHEGKSLIGKFKRKLVLQGL